jgi:hypothetical protein
MKKLKKTKYSSPGHFLSSRPLLMQTEKMRTLDQMPPPAYADGALQKKSKENE